MGYVNIVILELSLTDSSLLHVACYFIVILSGIRDMWLDTVHTGRRIGYMYL